MPHTHTLLRWMTHLNIGAFIATLAWLIWMHSMLQAASPVTQAQASALTCPAQAACLIEESRP